MLVVPTVCAVNVSVLPEAGAYVTLTAVAARYTGATAAVGVAATAVAVGSGETAAPSAFKTLIRPNRCPTTGSAAPRIWVDASALLRPLVISSAARPATCAAAADVPSTLP